MNIFFCIMIILPFLTDETEYGRHKGDFHVPISENRMSIPFYINDTNQILTNVCLGTPPQCFPFKISTSINASFVFGISLFNLGYNPKKSSTASALGSSVYFQYFLNKYQGNIIKDTLTIPGTSFKLENFPLYIVSKGEIPEFFVGVIGLGRKYVESQYSFLEMGKKSNYYEKLKFEIEYKKNKYGTLKLGYVNTSNSKIYKPTIMIDDKYEPRYLTILSGIIYHKEIKYNPFSITMTYNTPQIVLFSPGASHIFCPEEVFSFLLQSIFSEDFSIFDCHSEKRGNNFNTLKCKNNVLAVDKGNLFFVFGKWSINLKINNLFFQCHEELMCFHIMGVIGGNKWVFGHPFLKKFSTVCDSENSLIYLKKSNEQ